MTRSFSLTSLLLLTSLLTIANSAQAKGLAINPGMWETTITTVSQSLGTRTRTEKSCVEKDEFDVEQLLHDVVETQECENQANLLGDVLEYTFSCEAKVGMVFGEGNVTIDGDAMSGVMTMQVEAEGMSLGLNATVKSQRLGDC